MMSKHLSKPDEIILNKIYFIRGEKTMLDSDLAELYGVETKQLKRQVIRNLNGFLKGLCLNLQEKSTIL